MKSKQIMVLFLALIVILSGCELGMMKSVQIVTDPTVEVSLGERTGVFSEFLNIDEELANVTDDTEGLDRSAATAGAPISLHLQQEIISQSLDNLMGDTLNLGSIEQEIPAAGDPAIEFSIPAISESEAISLTVDPIAIPSDVNLPDTSLQDIPQENGTSPTIVQTVNTAGFSSVTFSGDTLACNTALENVSSGSPVVTINAAYLREVGTSTNIAAMTTSTAVGSPLVFDFNGNALPADFDVAIDLSITGGAGTSEDFDLTLTFPGTETISDATGISVDTTMDEASIAISLGNPDLISAEIGTGAIDISLDNFDTVVTDVNATISMSLWQGGAEQASVSDVAIGAGPEWDLSAVPLAAGDITLYYTVKLVSPVSEGSAFHTGTVTGSADASITNFDTIVLDGRAMEMDQEIITNLGSDITDLVDSVTFNSAAAITVDMTGNLPVNLEVTLDAPELEINSDTRTFTNAFGTESWGIRDITPILSIASLGDSLSVSDPDTDPDIDVTLDIDDGDGDDSILTLHNVDTDNTYNFAATVTADFTIDKVVIKGDSADPMIQGQFPESGADPLSFGDLKNVLPDSITFPDISASLDLSIPNGSGLTLGLLIWATYDDIDGNAQAVIIQGTDGDSDNIPDTKADIDQAWLTANGNAISFSALTTLVDARATDIYFYYEVYVNGATIDLTSASGDQTFAAAINADIPLKMRAASNASLELDGEPVIPAATEDIFGRDGSEDDDQTNDYLNMLSTASVNLTFTTPSNLSPKGEGLIGIGFSMTEDTNPAGYGDFELTKELTIVKGDTRPLSLSITPEQIARMIADDAFMPTYDVYLTTGDHQLVEGFDLDIGATMSIESDVNYTIDLGGNEE
ncbi:MAG: hypothetical protein JXA95_17415 [Spirochaetales bacterium]|nr:hypothetical protein [Spirochaetales bacterium]